MNTPTAPGRRSTGTPVHKRGLTRVVTGKTAYISDHGPPGTLEVAFARSKIAHGRIVAIDVTRAAASSGVVAVFTTADLPQLGSLPLMWSVPGQHPCPERTLADDRLLFVGHAYAVVVARDKRSAQAAAALIDVEVEPLPFVLDVNEALADDAPRLYPGWPGNVAARADWLVGDPDAQFAAAALIVEERFITQRVHPFPLDTRGIVAVPEDDDSLTLWVSTQAPHQVKIAVAHALGLPEHRLRIMVPDVGGAFGLKAYPYSEEALIACLALTLDRPVRWIEGRGESFYSSGLGRDQQVDLRVAFDTDGRMLALDGRILFNKGFQIGQTGIGTAWVGGAFLPGGYCTPAIRIETMAVVTNTPQTGAYRGYGQPEVNLAMERTLDIAAAQLGLSPAEIRRRNLVPAEAMPYTIATGVVLDSGDYRQLFDMTLDRFGYDEARARAAASMSSTLRRGVGVATYIETTNRSPSAGAAFLGLNTGSFELLTIRMESSGHVRVFSGATEMGQGVTTALAQLCADELMLPIEDVVIVHGDTSQASFTSYGTSGSAGAGVCGATALKGAKELKQRLLAWGAHLLQLEPEDVELAEADPRNNDFATRTVVRNRDEPDRLVYIADIARAAYLYHSNPPGVGPGLEIAVSYDAPGFGISYGTVAVALEVDTETGRVTIERITFGHDCGRIINPKIVEGQIVGAIAQAIGATLYETILYDEAGRTASTSIHDYLLPLAADMPPIEQVHLETPSPLYPHGVKGVGESGIIAVPAAIMNAVQQAIGANVTLNRLPLTAERVWRAIHDQGQ